MSKKYYSFLICRHQNHADLYVNGMHIGVIDNNKNFIIREFLDTNGEKYPCDIFSVPDFPFQNFDDLKNELLLFVNSIKL